MQLNSTNQQSLTRIEVFKDTLAAQEFTHQQCALLHAELATTIVFAQQLVNEARALQEQIKPYI